MMNKANSLNLGNPYKHLHSTFFDPLCMFLRLENLPSYFSLKSQGII